MVVAIDVPNADGTTERRLRCKEHGELELTDEFMDKLAYAREHPTERVTIHLRPVPSDEGEC
jgi:hypothetical protein